METVIKNIHLVRPHFIEEQIERLEHGALQYRKFARITFKVISYRPFVDHSEITVEVRQDKSPAENYLTAAELHARAKDLFSPFMSKSSKVYTNTIPYQPSVVEEVTPEFIRHYMTNLKIKVKEIATETGLDATNVSAWVNGSREMSNIVKAMFYYYFLNRRRDLTKREHTPSSLFTLRIEDDTYTTALLTPMHDPDGGAFRLPLGVGAKAIIEREFVIVEDGKQLILKGG